MANVNVDHGLDQKDISAYFDGQSNTLIWVGLVVLAVLYSFMDTVGAIIGIALLGYILYKRFGTSGLTDEEIDAAWVKIAESRRDEAHRVALIEKDDTIRKDIQSPNNIRSILMWTWSLSPNVLKL